MHAAKLITTLRAGHSGPTMLQISGEVDLSSAHELRTRLADLIDAGHRCLVLDLSGMSFCDATGLGAFLAGHQRMSQRGGWLGLCGMQPIVARIFHITSLDEVFSIYATPEEALRAGRRSRHVMARRGFGRRVSTLPRRNALPSHCRRSGGKRTGLRSGLGRRGAAGNLRPIAQVWSKTCRAVRRLRSAVARSHSADPPAAVSLARSVSAAVRWGRSLGVSRIRRPDWKSSTASMISPRVFITKGP